MPISTTLQKNLDAAVAAKDFYGAHQIYLSIVNRLVKQSQYDEAAEVIAKGSSWLFQFGQSKSALDLSSKLFDTIKEPWSEDLYPERVSTVLSALPINHSGVRGLIAQLLRSSQNSHKLHGIIGDLASASPRSASGDEIDYEFAALHYGKAGPSYLQQHISCIEKAFKENIQLGANVLTSSVFRYLEDKNGHSAAYELSSTVIKTLFFGDHQLDKIRVASVEMVPCILRAGAVTAYFQLAVFESNDEETSSAAALLNLEQLMIFATTRTDPKLGLEKLRAHYFAGLSQDLKLLFAKVERAYLTHPSISMLSEQARTPNITNIFSTVLGRMMHPHPSPAASRREDELD